MARACARWGIDAAQAGDRETRVLRAMLAINREKRPAPAAELAKRSGIKAAQVASVLQTALGDGRVARLNVGSYVLTEEGERRIA